jgi:ankyrin repeat protein
MTINQFEAARGGADTIRVFAAAGGNFTDEQNEYGMTAAMYAAKLGADAIRAFAQAGGRFTDERSYDRYAEGYTAAMFAARNGPHAIKAFADAGGKVTDQKNKYGHTARYYAAAYDADALEALETAVATQKKAGAPQQESGVAIRPAPKTSAPPPPSPT